MQEITIQELELLRKISNYKADIDFYNYIVEKSKDELSKMIDMCNKKGINPYALSTILEDDSRAGADMILARNDIKVIK